MSNLFSHNKAYNEGWEAYWKGADQDANSYTDPQLRDEWNLGWVTAQKADKEGT